MKVDCYFSTDISETLSCCKDGNFDFYGFPENVCEKFPCDFYNYQILREKERHFKNITEEK
jgi:hypothetical protein